MYKLASSSNNCNNLNEYLNSIEFTTYSAFESSPYSEYYSIYSPFNLRLVERSHLQPQEGVINTMKSFFK